MNDDLDRDDIRRAAALTAHYLRGDGAAVEAVLAEAVTVHRVSGLVFAILALVDEITGLCARPDMADALTRYATLLAAEEATP